MADSAAHSETPTIPAPPAALTLLGYPVLTLAGKPPDRSLPGKALALLAYLAMENQREHSREQLATLLWPEADGAAGRNSLRQILHALRQALPDTPQLLAISRPSIALSPEADLWLDVNAFTDLLDTCEAHAHRSLDACPACMERLTQAEALYQDDFLAGFFLPDSDVFLSWQVAHQERLRSRMLAALAHLADFRLRRQEYGQAIGHLQRVLSMAPWQEESHRHLMRAMALDGQRGAALNQYETCIRLLAEELHVAPSPETAALRDQIEAGLLEREWMEAGNPYRGLLPFDEQHAADFHGRDRLVHVIATALEESSLVTVVGPSGSGKSSLLHAGILPRLQASDSSLISSEDQNDVNNVAPVIVVDFWPGQEPFQSLAEALSPLLSTPQDERRLAAALRTGEESLATLASTVSTVSTAPGHSPGHVFFVVDQFEELFTLCSDAQTRQDFLDLLLSASTQTPAESEDPSVTNSKAMPSAKSQAPITVLLALRADFMGQALAYRPLADAIQLGGVMVGPMSPEGLRQAVEEPALNRGAQFEAGLVERILADVGDDPGNLPLLQFCLTQLWGQQVIGTLTHSAYDGIGGLAGALSRYADQIFTRLSNDEQVVARQALMRLVQPGDAAADTRRWAGRQELEEDGWRLVQQLADARLVVTDRTSQGHEQAALAHEALIQHWERLHGWLEQNQALRLFQHQLLPFVRQWETTGRDDGALLRGALLAEAEKFEYTEGAKLSDTEHDFISTSISARDQRLFELETLQQSELRQARLLAETEQRQARAANRTKKRLAWMTAGLTMALLLALLAMLTALHQQRVAQGNAEIAAAAQAEAEKSANVASAAQAKAESEGARAETQSQIALSRQLAAQAISLADEELDIALLLSLESLDISSSAADRAALLSDLVVPPSLTSIRYGPSEPIYNLGFGSEGTTLLSAGERGLLLRWDLSGGQPVTITLPAAVESDPDTNDPRGFAFGNDGRFVAETHGPGFTLWDIDQGEALFSQLEAHTSDIDGLFLTADGKRLLSRDDENNLRLWNTDFESDVNGSRLVSSPSPLEDGVTRSLSPAGDKLAMTLLPDQLSISLWDVESGQAIGEPMPAHTAQIHGATFSPDGALLATASFDGSVRLWDAVRGAPLFEPLLAHDGRVLSVAFSPDGRTLASGGTDNMIYLWDTATGELTGLPLSGHGNWVRALRYSEDGQTLFAADAGGRVLTWDVGAHRTLRGHEKRVRGVGISPDGRFLITSGFDGAIVVWDAATGAETGRIDNAHNSSIIQIAISPDGVIASAEAAGIIKLWDLKTLEALHPPLLGHESVVIGLTFSLDGATLASGDFDGFVQLWDTSTLLNTGESSVEQIGAALDAHEGWALSLAFSPDGAILASGGTEGDIKLWQTPDVDAGETNLEPLGEPLTGHENWVTWLVFNPDGETLASTSSDHTIRFWDTSTVLSASVVAGEQMGEPLTDHEDQVWSAQFDPASDGQVLVTLGGDGSVLRWDFASRELLSPPLLTDKETETMTLSPDGRNLIIGSFDETASQWRLDALPWAERACTIANRDLTHEEWQQYLGDRPYQKNCLDLP